MELSKQCKGFGSRTSTPTADDVPYLVKFGRRDLAISYLFHFGFQLVRVPGEPASLAAYRGS